jgi:hypothetical protein
MYDRSNSKAADTLIPLSIFRPGARRLNSARESLSS